MSRALRVPAAARATLAMSRPAASGLRARQMCDMAPKGVQVDMVCRMWSCRVADDASAHEVKRGPAECSGHECVVSLARMAIDGSLACARAQMDCAFDEMIDDVSEVEGCAGASRLVCKTEWDYKFILKFEDLESLQNYMKNDHERLSAVHLPQIESLAVGKVSQQNFVYDDIE